MKPRFESYWMIAWRQCARPDIPGKIAPAKRFLLRFPFPRRGVVKYLERLRPSAHWIRVQLHSFCSKPPNDAYIFVPTGNAIIGCDDTVCDNLVWAVVFLNILPVEHPQHRHLERVLVRHFDAEPGLSVKSICIIVLLCSTRNPMNQLSPTAQRWSS